MKRISLFALLMTIVILCGSATPIPNNGPAAPTPKHFDTYYYWYDTSSGNYIDYGGVSNEINELEEDTGCPVNQTAAGGTEVEAGYIDNTDPHDAWPQVLLYTHC